MFKLVKSLCCTPKINVALCVNYTTIKKKKKKKKKKRKQKNQRFQAVPDPQEL